MANPIPPGEWQKLLEDYRKAIPDKLDALQRLILAAQKSPAKEALEALRFAVHKLAGNASTYGFAAVSVICKKTELEIVEAINHLPPDPKWLANLTLFHSKVQEAFRGKK